MRVPKRKGEEDRLALAGEEDRHYTKEAIRRMETERNRLLKTDRPALILEMQRAAEMGDFSENFAYQQAKHALRRMNSRIDTLEERIKFAIPIEKSSGDGIAKLGTTVTLVNEAGEQKTYELVGPLEAHPPKNRISHLSPLGSLLIGKTAGETVTLPNGITWTIAMVA